MLLDPHEHMLEWEKHKYTVYRNKCKVEEIIEINILSKLLWVQEKKTVNLDWEDREATCKW